MVEGRIATSPFIAKKFLFTLSIFRPDVEQSTAVLKIERGKSDANESGSRGN